jgi:hypothetical protein
VDKIMWISAEGYWQYSKQLVVSMLRATGRFVMKRLATKSFYDTWKSNGRSLLLGAMVASIPIVYRVWKLNSNWVPRRIEEAMAGEVAEGFVDPDELYDTELADLEEPGDDENPPELIWPEAQLVLADEAVGDLGQDPEPPEPFAVPLPHRYRVKRLTVAQAAALYAKEQCTYYEYSKANEAMVKRTINRYIEDNCKDLRVDARHYIVSRALVLAFTPTNADIDKHQAMHSLVRQRRLEVLETIPINSFWDFLFWKRGSTPQ